MSVLAAAAESALGKLMAALPGARCATAPLPSAGVFTWIPAVGVVRAKTWPSCRWCRTPWRATGNSPSGIANPTGETGRADSGPAGPGRQAGSTWYLFAGNSARYTDLSRIAHGRCQDSRPGLRAPGELRPRVGMAPVGGAAGRRAAARRGATQAGTGRGHMVQKMAGHRACLGNGRTRWLDHPARAVRARRGGIVCDPRPGIASGSISALRVAQARLRGGRRDSPVAFASQSTQSRGGSGTVAAFLYVIAHYL